MGEFNRPFRGSDAVRRGALTRFQLSRHYRICPDIYIRRGIGLTPILRAEAAALWAGDDGVLGGFSAAALLGTKWIASHHPATVFRQRSRRSVRGIEVRVADLLPAEIVSVGGLRITSPARTAFDLGRWLSARDVDFAITVLDAICQATKITVPEILTVLDNHPGAHGQTRLRQVLDLVDGGAESPQETATRLVLVRAGLPTPKTQVEVRNEWDFLIATCDLGWERWRLVVEYDGEDHWTHEPTRTKDITRYQELDDLGWQYVRVSSRMLRGEHKAIIDRVRRKLRDAGCPI